MLTTGKKKGAKERLQTEGVNKRDDKRGRAATETAEAGIGADSKRRQEGLTAQHESRLATKAVKKTSNMGSNKD